MSALEHDSYDDPPPPAGMFNRRPPGGGARIPPHDLAVEESLLGAMLLSRDAISAAAEVGIGADDFYKPAHGHVYDAITTLYKRGEPVDPVTVADVLHRSELLDAIGGPALLVTLQAGTPATTSAGKYARIVEELSLLRRLIAVAGEISENAYSASGDVTATIDRAETMVFEVAQRRVTDSLTKISDLLDQNLDRLEALYARGESITGVPTGFTDLDEILAGLQPSNLVVIGARPAMGKCLALDARITDALTGENRTIEEIVQAGQRGEDTPMWGITDKGSLRVVHPSHFIDDGLKPTYRVRTRLGREVTVTGSHPFLTFEGWKPLVDLGVGTRIAVPRILPTFGTDELPDDEVKLLGYLIGDGGLTGSTPRFTTASEVIREEVEASGAALGVDMRVDSRRGAATSYRLSRRPGKPNHLTARLREHGLMGTGSHDKFVPRAIFRLRQGQIALFLSRLFATDGSAWWTDAGDGYGRISYCTVSKRLAHDVQHLLLRFGLNARIRTKQVKYGDGRNTAYELELMAAEEIRRFAEYIGIFSKEARVAHLVAKLSEKANGGYTADSLPRAVWDEILAAKAELTWSEVSRRAGKPSNHNWHVGTRSPRRETVQTLSRVTGDLGLFNRAISHVYWDEIVAIEDAGLQQVYDLTVPELHNFVADDVCVHNTAFALGLATHAALEARRPVLVFSLEMGQLEVSQRILCAEARVDSSRVRTGKLTDADWGKISNAVGRIAEGPIYIDDNANITVMDIRAKARRLKSQLGDLGVVIIDYVQLMTGRSNAESRQVEVSEISRNLKILARELETPVIALAQLNRALETRADKRPMLSDLRESGCLTGATRLLRADTNAEVTLAELVESGARDVPVWSLDEDMKLVASRLTHAFASGIKETFEVRLASGRSVEASANHPFLTLQGWTRVDELSVGSRVAVPKAIPAPTDVRYLPDAEVVLLAHMIGDGCAVARQPIHYTSADVENLEAVEKAAAHFGITPRRVQQGNWWHVYLPAPERLTHGKRNPIAAWLDTFGLFGLRSYEKFVPAEIFALEDRQVALFLHHLWATDGSLSTTSGRAVVHYASTSRQLVDDVRMLLLRFGIQSRITAAQKGSHRPGYQLKVNGARDTNAFLDRIGIQGTRGRRIPEILRSQRPSPKTPYVEALPAEVTEWVRTSQERAGISALELGRRAGFGNFRMHRSPLDPSRLAAVAGVLHDDELRRVAEADVLWDRVVSITPLGEKPVFDATVARTHNFIANGICLENSLEQDADIVMFLYRDEVYNPDSQDRGTAEVIVAKHRNGPVGKVRLAWLDHYTKFANMARGV